MIYFTSDTHFGHKKLVAHRGFTWWNTSEENLHAMDGTLLWNLQALVEPEALYILGDVSFYNYEKTKKILSLFEFPVYIIKGNHDNDKMYAKLEREGVIKWARSLHTVRYQGQKIVLCHFPLEVWNGCHRGYWHLHGHSHGSLEQNRNIKRMDVGADTNDLKPYSFSDIKKIMDTRGFDPVDHHR